MNEILCSSLSFWLVNGIVSILVLSLVLASGSHFVLCVETSINLEGILFLLVSHKSKLRKEINITISYAT